MRLSRYFLPLIKENPTEAAIISHRLMLRAGMVRQVGSGIYNWLPLGLRVLKKIENIVREEMDRAGAVEILMPTMQPAELWHPAVMMITVRKCYASLTATTATCCLAQPQKKL